MSQQWFHVLAKPKPCEWNKGRGGHIRVIAKFRTQIDADLWADEIRVMNPTWFVVVREHGKRKTSLASPSHNPAVLETEA